MLGTLLCEGVAVRDGTSLCSRGMLRSKREFCSDALIIGLLRIAVLFSF